MIYKFRTPVANLDPNVVGVELERIREEHSGHLKTEDVVREAADPASPIHPAFNWDDESAAYQHRLWQARQIIRNVQVVYEDGREPAPAFYNVSITTTEGTERYYQNVKVIANSPVEYQAALKTMRSKLSDAERGLNQLLDIAPKKEQPRVRRATGHIEKAHQLLSSPG